MLPAVVPDRLLALETVAVNVLLTVRFGTVRICVLGLYTSAVAVIRSALAAVALSFGEKIM
jgi:hypothetical protein